tara:strand:+ start:377 stop:841 length:465 start_codon:yes stop_codon:yes gene_type:complete
MGSCTSKKQTMEETLKDYDWKSCKPYVPNIKEGKIIKCYDGDTVTIATIVEKIVVRFNIRMLGYDCAEIKSKDTDEKQVAKWAKEYISEMILNKMVKVVKNGGYDKYGRLLLEIEIDGKNVNKIMLEKWGVEYYGKHKEEVDWSKWNIGGRQKE